MYLQIIPAKIRNISENSEKTFIYSLLLLEIPVHATRKHLNYPSSIIHFNDYHGHVC